MIFIYGECRGNNRLAANVYAQRFPNLRHPSYTTIRNVTMRFRETGSVRDRPRSGRPRSDDTAVLAYFHAYPHSSTREVSMACGLTQPRIMQILKRNKMHPYSCFLQQALHYRDYALRLDWCNFLLNKEQQNNLFISTVLWSDESKFTQDGIINRHNIHYWADNNPHWNRNARHQVRWSLNVWCGMYGKRIVGPFLYRQNLNGDRYLRILENTVQDFLEDIPLQRRLTIWFQQDGAPAHKPRAIKQWLNNTFGDRWMGEHGPVRWPPRSPDLTPLDYFLWGHVKSIVYATPPRDILDLEQRIYAAFATIDEATIERSINNVIVRAQHCIVAQGAHFEYVLV
jgi:hypothetical protein